MCTNRHTTDLSFWLSVRKDKKTPDPLRCYRDPSCEGWLKSGVWKNEPPVKILIPLGDLANEIKQRLPFAAAAKDLPRGRKRAGWKQAFRAALVEASRDLDGVSEEQILEAVKGYRKARAKPGLIVVAEAAEATA